MTRNARKLRAWHDEGTLKDVPARTFWPKSYEKLQRLLHWRNERDRIRSKQKTEQR